MTQTTTGRFPLGAVVITAGAKAALAEREVLAALDRHVAGDWGDVEPADAQCNDDALTEGTRLLSSYTDRRGTRFWIITEADRSSTTVLLPQEY